MLHGKEIAAEIVKNRSWESFPENAAKYDADFPEKGEPALCDIVSFKSGHGFGYVIIHHFLNRVGKGKTFVITPPSPYGTKLFDRLVAEGVLIQEPDTNDPEYPHRFRVMKDLMENLAAYASPGNRGPFMYSAMGITPEVT